MNKQFLEQIIAVYGSSIYSFCIYLTQNITEADDLYQNTFIKAIELDNLNLSINPKSYLLGIASNLWKNEKRKRLLRIKKVPRISFEELEQTYLANTTCSPQEMLEKAETAREVKQAVYNMEDNHKEVLSSADKKIGAFSGGMRQRLGIAQAVIGNPKVLIFDEPTAGLDPQERIRFRNVISSLGADKIVLLATHIVTDIAFIAKEVILIQNGELIKKSSQQELTESINGKVWEVDVEPSLVPEYMNKYFISNVLNSNNKTILRIISDNQSGQKATTVTPNMEDVCIYYFGK